MNSSYAKKTFAGILSAAMIFTMATAVMVEPNSATFSASAETASSDVIFSADFEDGVNAFTRRGTNETLTIDNTVAHGGKSSLCVSDRAKSWNGPQLAMDKIITAGTEYVVSAYAKTEWYSSLTLSKQYNDSTGTTHYENILAANNDGSSWSEYSNVKFSFPAGSTDMYLYFEAGDSNVKIYVDDFSVSNAPDVAIEDIASLSDVYAGYFKIGTAIGASSLASKPYMKLVNKHFKDSVTFGNELKPDFVLDKAACLADYEKTGDDTNPQVSLTSAKSLLDYCRDNNIPVRGHTLVWHSQTPDWFFKVGYSDDGAWVSKDVMIKRMENYIKNLMELIAKEYPTVNFYSWDVVNEAWTDGGTPRTAGSNNTTSGNSAWVQVFGDNSFIDYAFEFARKYAPKGCKLYYNDYNEYIGSKTDAICKMANELKEKGLIDGIGMQSHLDVSFPSASAYEKALSKFAATGLDIQVTELDITTSDTSTAGLEKQAQAYSDIFDSLVKYADNISAVILWGVTDDTSWRASKAPLLFDAEYKAKPAFYSIIDGVVPKSTEPTTATSATIESTTVSAEPTTAFSGKYGDANCDDKIDISDVVAVRRFLVSKDKYALTAQGVKNADVLASDGVNAQDAVAIQQYVFGNITSLPVKN